MAADPQIRGGPVWDRFLTEFENIEPLSHLSLIRLSNLSTGTMYLVGVHSHWHCLASSFKLV